MLKRFFATAYGRVQGVGFRMFVRMNAGMLGIGGWVKNMPDGTVTMELQGEESDLHRLVEILKAGAYFIRVDRLELEEIVPEIEENAFEIR